MSTATWHLVSTYFWLLPSRAEGGKHHHLFLKNTYFEWQGPKSFLNFDPAKLIARQEGVSLMLRARHQHQLRPFLQRPLRNSPRSHHLLDSLKFPTIPRLLPRGVYESADEESYMYIQDPNRYRKQQRLYHYVPRSTLLPQAASISTMASATIISNAPGATTSIPSRGDKDAGKRPQTASEWAQLLRQQLRIIDESQQTANGPQTMTIDEIILDAPRRRAADKAAAELAQQIATLMYPDLDRGELGPIIQYEEDFVRLRRLVAQQRKRIIEDNTKRKKLVNWGPRIIKQGAWNPSTDPISLHGAPSLPMPVEIAEPESLAPFFEHLALGGKALPISTDGDGTVLFIKEPYYDTPAIEVQRGVEYSDGRMDLCKMVLGPNNIGALMQSLRTNKTVKHFLLGTLHSDFHISH